jgi:uncharacterized protein involved in exopolysaccharide biosynthesis
VVTKLAAHSRSYVVAVRQKVLALTKTLGTLGDSVVAQSKTFNADVKRLTSDIDSFNARARTPGGFATLGQFNVQRAALITRQHSLKQRLKKLEARFATFDSDLDKLKDLSSTAAGLVKSLNIELDPLPGLSA